MPNLPISGLPGTSDPQALLIPGERLGINYKIDLGAAIDAIVNTTVASGGVPPVAPGATPGVLYVDTAGSDLYIWNGVSWVQMNSEFLITTGLIAPVAPGVTTGDIYTNTATGDIYIWDGGVWKLNSATGASSGPVITAGIVPPVAPGVTIGDIYADTVTGNLYSWDGAAWIINIATDELSKVSAADTTPGYLEGKVVAGTNIDATKLNPGANESLEVKLEDNITLNSVTVEDLNVNNSANFTGATITYTQVVQNFVGVPVQISCEGAPAFGAPFAAPALTQYAEIKVEYDNGVDPVIAKTIKTVYNGLNQLIQFPTLNDTGELTVSWAAGSVTVAITSATPGFFSFAAVTPRCYYNGVSINNYDNKIHNHNGDITENTNTYTTNMGTTTVYDATSIVTINGTLIVDGQTVLAGPVTGVANPALISTTGRSVVASAVQVLAVPVSTTMLWVQIGPTTNIYLRKGIYQNTGVFNIGSPKYSFVWDTGANTLTIGVLGITGASAGTTYNF